MKNSTTAFATLVLVLSISSALANNNVGALVVSPPNNVFNTFNACSGGIIYINPSSSSNGQGTLVSPYNSWAAVLPKAGGCYLQKAGTVSTVLMTVSAQGTSVSPIILGAYGTGQAPIIQNSVNLQNAAYVILQGLQFTKSPYAAIIIQQGSHHILINNNSIFNTPMGIWIGNAAGGNNIISGNKIFSNTTFGIGVNMVNNISGQESLIINNTIYDNGSHGIELEGNRFNVVNNILYGNGKTTPGSSGIHMYAGGYQGQPFVDAGSYNYVAGNAVYGTLDGAGQDGNGIEVDQHTHDNVIVNNFLFNNDGAGIVAYDSWSNQIQHNVSLNNSIDIGHSHAYRGEMILAAESSATNLTNNNTLLENTFIAVSGNVHAIVGDAWTANNSQNFQNNYFYNTAGYTVYSWGNTLGSSETAWNTMTTGSGNKFSGLTILKAVPASSVYYNFKFDNPFLLRLDGKDQYLLGWNSENSVFSQ